MQRHAYQTKTAPRCPKCTPLSTPMHPHRAHPCSEFFACARAAPAKRQLWPSGSMPVGALITPKSIALCGPSDTPPIAQTLGAPPPPCTRHSPPARKASVTHPRLHSNWKPPPRRVICNCQEILQFSEFWLMWTRTRTTVGVMASHVTYHLSPPWRFARHSARARARAGRRRLHLALSGAAWRVCPRGHRGAVPRCCLAAALPGASPPPSPSRFGQGAGVGVSPRLARRPYLSRRSARLPLPPPRRQRPLTRASGTVSVPVPLVGVVVKRVLLRILREYGRSRGKRAGLACRSARGHPRLRRARSGRARRRLGSRARGLYQCVEAGP